MPDQSENISNQPLTPAVFHILLALADGEKHGYGIMKDVEDQTSGQIKMGPGTLYGSIKRMLAVGLIEETDERPDPALDDERRRYYRLTTQGRRWLPPRAGDLYERSKWRNKKGCLSIQRGALMKRESWVAGSRRLYAWLLKLYPKDHVEEYGAAMLQVFTDQCREISKEQGFQGWSFYGCVRS